MVHLTNLNPFWPELPKVGNVPSIAFHLQLTLMAWILGAGTKLHTPTSSPSMCPRTRPLPTPRTVSTKPPLQRMPPETHMSLSINRCQATPPQTHHSEPRPTRHRPTDRRTRHSGHGNRCIIPRHSGPRATTTTRARTLIHWGRKIGKKVAETAPGDGSPTFLACSRELDWIFDPATASYLAATTNQIL